MQFPSQLLLIMSFQNVEYMYRLMLLLTWQASFVVCLHVFWFDEENVYIDKLALFSGFTPGKTFYSC